MKIISLSTIILSTFLFTTFYAPAIAHVPLSSSVQGVEANNIHVFQTNKDITRIADEYSKLNKKEKQAIIAYLLSDYKNAIPGMYVVVADDIFPYNKKAAAAIMTFGRYRTFQDSLTCKDSTATAINQAILVYAPKTGEYFSSLSDEEIADMFEFAVKFDEKHPERPSPKWACYHGIRAFDGKVELYPKRDFAKIRQEFKEKTIKIINELRTK